MARINLLPWRQEERERKNKEFAVMAGAVIALSILAALLALTFFNNTLSNQMAANQLIEDENTRLEKVLTDIASLEEQRDAMLSRMKVIQDLQGRRSVPVRVWDDIARAVPQTMYLLSMSRQGDTITITGMADNASSVSQLVRNLDASPWLANSGIPNISNNQTQTGSSSGVSGQPFYPEERYIAFTVTTQVAFDDVQTQTDGSTPQQPAQDIQQVSPQPELQQPPVVPTPDSQPQPVAQPTEAQPTPPAVVDAPVQPVANEQPTGGQ